MQVAPAELEALFARPTVANAAAIGRQDEGAGEVADADLIARGALHANALKARLAKRVAPPKKLADGFPRHADRCDEVAPKRYEGFALG